MRTSHPILFTCLIAYVGLSGCTSSSDNVQDPIVASWDEYAITLAEFEDSYLSFWQTTSEADSPELRARIARQLLEQDLLADRARIHGMHKIPSIQQRVQRDFKRYIRTAYLEEEVKTQVAPPTDRDVKLALQQRQKRYFVRQLFSLTKEGIDSLAHRLDAGEEFIELAHTTLPDPELAQQGGTLGWLGWGDTDLPVEEVLFSLEYGDISPPVQSLMGWHIFRVDSVEQTLKFGLEDAKAYEDTKAELLNRRFDLLAAHHIRDFVWEQDLAIDLNVLRSIWYELAPLLPRNASQSIQPILERISEHHPPDLANSVVAQVNGNAYTVRQFYEAPPQPASRLHRPQP